MLHSLEIIIVLIDSFKVLSFLFLKLTDYGTVCSQFWESCEVSLLTAYERGSLLSAGSLDLWNSCDLNLSPEWTVAISNLTFSNVF